MNMNNARHHPIWFSLGLLAIFLSFIAVFSPLIKIPIVGKISYWKAEPIGSVIYLFGTLMAMWFLSKDLYRKLWLSSITQLMSFGCVGLTHWWVAEQKSHFSQAVSTLSSPVTNFTADVLLNRAAWQPGMIALLCSFVILLLVSLFTRFR